LSTAFSRAVTTAADHCLTLSVSRRVWLTMCCRAARPKESRQNRGQREEEKDQKKKEAWRGAWRVAGAFFWG
jgi:hypothetical protein